MGRFRKAFLVMVKIVGWLQKRVNFRKTETRKPLCRKALRRFQKMGLTKSYYVPNQARYQLRYTRIFNFCHYTTAEKKIKDFSVCGHSCGQSRFCAAFSNQGKSRKCRCHKALRRFVLPCPGYRHGTPKAGALPTAQHPVMKLGDPVGRIHPNQARYQLRYTWILLILE